MKTSILLACAIMSVATNSIAQDIITKNDSTKLTTQLISIKPTEINFKLFHYSEGPIVTINKEEVAYITFKNGEVERISKTKENTATQTTSYNPNTYNLDNDLLSTLTPRTSKKDLEKLYKYKNYIGFNYLLFMNGCLGFNYIRDFRKQNLIINIPFAFGVWKPSVTNSLYSNLLRGNYNSNSIYNNLNYQVGLNVLFTPFNDSKVNFLVGPSFNFTEYSVSTKCTNSIYNYNNPSSNVTLTYVNSFKVYRQHYGVTVGLLARISERVNMNMQLSLGAIKDSYNKKDPFGDEYLSNGAYDYYASQRKGVQAYATILWSVGYKF